MRDVLKREPQYKKTQECLDARHDPFILPSSKDREGAEVMSNVNGGRLCPGFSPPRRAREGSTILVLYLLPTATKRGDVIAAGAEGYQPRTFAAIAVVGDDRHWWLVGYARFKCALQSIGTIFA